VVIGNGGVLYGTTAGGGSSGDGTVFSLGVPITLTFQGTGSGTVTPTGATTPTAFTNAPFSFVFTTDTTQITTFSSTFNTPCVTGATVSVAGMSGAISTGMQAQVNAPYINLSACTSSGSTAIFGGTNASFAEYNLQSPIGPLPLGDLDVGIGAPSVITSFGGLRLTGVSAATFTVTTGASTALGTILSISEGSTHDFLIIGTGAVETSWTQTGTYSNVSISAALANGPDNVFLTNKIGPGTTAANVIASATPAIAGQTSGAASLTTLFTGLTLGPGTYYLVVQGGDWDEVDTAGTSTLAPGITLSGTDFALTPNAFVPASSFSQADPTGPFLKMSIAGDAGGAYFKVALSAAGQVEPFAAGSIVSAYGTNLATGTASASSLPPTSLDGTTVTVTDSAGVARPAPLFYVSPVQVNYEIPAATATGTATVSIQNQNGTTQTATIQIGNVSPGLFQLNTSGLVAAWVLPVDSGVQGALQPVYQLGAGNSVIPLPIDLGPSTEQVYLEMYGTGIRNANTVDVTVGGVSVPVLFTGGAPGYAGEDQVNIGPLPRSLAGQGSVSIVISADGQVANTVKVTIQ
jgi:uncharacterized protein (TIGR03437 family)